MRDWANKGLVRVARTRGGHRRFSSKEIRKLSQHKPVFSANESQLWEEKALQLIQRRLRNASAAQSWHSAMRPEAGIRFRIYGRRMLSILVSSGSVAKRARNDIDEAHELGQEYGREMLAHGQPLSRALSSLVFCRDGVLDTAPGDVSRHIIRACDGLTNGLVEAYETAEAETRPSMG